MKPQPDIPKIRASGSSPGPAFVPVAELTPVSEDNVAALSFWRTLPRESGFAPRKEACDVLQIAEQLPRCLLIDIEGPTLWPIRMFGTALVEHFGLDATGLNAWELYEEAERKNASDRLGVASTHPAVMLLRTRLVNLRGVPLTTEWVLMPLGDHEDNVCAFIGTITSIDHDHSAREFEFDGSLKGRTLVDLIYGDLSA